ncbi:hypothetical protein C5B42_05725 [Candidatus Cerribacteria bacterium 'Amazon FNV 2010 28 9']|uniref:Bacterial bifunctional deaminase-reductase C-terminal domain-containing protein n=1 Tax=Candidatus Cerribacteria bacterium 'Amazon FNV 2010 28 9' TaxID=2081795 RepID=A0A317JPU5_9BACT|nr:MAG: hypothetical protein C5B42_05725 [Candidatus Cerribacteria bacterium 'Amazon FNV 2010 28 9']
MPNERPYVICHMMSTIDGKVASGIDGVDILADYFDLYTKTEDELKAKAWMCGRVTMQMFAEGVNTPLHPIEQGVGEQDFLVTKENNIMFGVDTKGMLRWKSNTITLSNVQDPLQLVVIVTNTTPQEYLAYLQEKQISYLFAGEDEIDFSFLLQKIQTIFGIPKLLLEGGALLNGSVMAANAIDEISLLLTPLVANRSSCPSLFERTVQEELQTKRFSLSSVQQTEKDCVWLRYKRN